MKQKPINHKRLDMLQSWAAHVGSDDTVAGEFEGLRRLEKLSRSQGRRVEHLEWHLDRGDVICECYEKILPIPE